MRGQPVRRFERRPGALAEALDGLVDATAARHVPSIQLEAALRDEPVAPPPTVVSSPWVSVW